MQVYQNFSYELISAFFEGTNWESIDVDKNVAASLKLLSSGVSLAVWIMQEPMSNLKDLCLRGSTLQKQGQEEIVKVQISLKYKL